MNLKLFFFISVVSFMTQRGYAMEQHSGLAEKNTFRAIFALKQKVDETIEELAVEPIEGDPRPKKDEFGHTVQGLFLHIKRSKCYVWSPWGEIHLTKGKYKGNGQGIHAFSFYLLQKITFRLESPAMYNEDGGWVPIYTVKKSNNSKGFTAREIATSDIGPYLLDKKSDIVTSHRASGDSAYCVDAVDGMHLPEAQYYGRGGPTPDSEKTYQKWRIAAQRYK